VSGDRRRWQDEHGRRCDQQDTAQVFLGDDVVVGGVCEREDDEVREQDSILRVLRPQDGQAQGARTGVPDDADVPHASFQMTLTP